MELKKRSMPAELACEPAPGQVPLSNLEARFTRQVADIAPPFQAVLLTRANGSCCLADALLGTNLGRTRLLVRRSYDAVAAPALCGVVLTPGAGAGPAEWHHFSGRPRTASDRNRPKTSAMLLDYHHEDDGLGDRSGAVRNPDRAHHFRARPNLTEAPVNLYGKSVSDWAAIIQPARKCGVRTGNRCRHGR